MKTQKGRITKLITSVNEKIPDGIDIYGYAGIDKTKIIRSLEESYYLLGLIEDFTDDMETVWVKRKIAKLIDSSYDILKTINDEAWKDNFDKFLDSISDIRSMSKDTYLALTKNPIRTDIQIKKAEEELLKLETILTDITNDIALIKENSQKADGLIEKLELVTSTIEQHSSNAELIIQKYDNALEELTESNEQSSKMMTEISKIRESSKDLNTYLIETKTSIDVLSKKSEMAAATIETNQTTLNSQMIKDKELQFEIEQTLQDVNKHGMAGAFKKRKDELRWTVIVWGTLSVISISVLVGLTYNFAKDIFDSQTFDPIKNLFKLPSAIAGVWLCWFCGKQFGYSMRIREDYSFKYAISMAFEGYKNETREINEDLLEKLLQMTIGNISINPTSIYDSKTNHGSPWHEFAAGIRSFLKLMRDLKQRSIQMIFQKYKK